ncbi:hypothetical protein C8R44DRAFT_23058 [Mycena epipterygia]|nr:hypothetical protein C8R44DRAFT_23058 [Mycena epipterygia]
MTTNVAIVDDRDPLIHYTGAWIGAGSPAEFSSTTTVSVTEGTTASFTFVGSSITVYGTVAAKNPPLASLSFAVDDSITGSYTPPSNMASDIHHEALWTSPTMSDEVHTLIITQTAAQIAGVIFLDYLMYNTTSTSVGSYFIDDRDPRITYTPAWKQFEGDEDFQHTSQESTSRGDSFSLKFAGKAISFYGGITAGDAGVMNASIVLDGGAPVIFVAPTNPPASSNNLIYTSGDISDAAHTLVVTSLNDQPVWTDYFLVTPGTASSTTSSSGSSSSTSTASSGSSSSVPPSKKSTHIGAIVGGAVGGVVLIALAVIAALFFFRRRNRRQQLQPADVPMANVLTPFSDSVVSGAPGSTYGYSAIAASDANFVSDPSSAPGNTTELRPTPTQYASGSSSRNTTESVPVPAPLLPRKLAQEARRLDVSSGTGTRSGARSDVTGSSRAGDEAPPQYSE